MIGGVSWPIVDRVHLGDVAISPHGIAIAAGFVAGLWSMRRSARRVGVDARDVDAIAIRAIVGALVGARLAYVVGHGSELGSIGDVFRLWEGGFSLLGGIAGGVLANLPLLRRRGYRFLQVADAAVIALALGITLGRVGDLAIGDHLGRPTDSPFGFEYTTGELAPPFQCVERADEDCTVGSFRAELSDGSVATVDPGGATLRANDGSVVRGSGVHQTALYDLVSSAALLAFLLWLRRRAPREGTLTLVFGVWYGVVRLLTDSVRIDQRIGGLTGSQWASLVVVAVAIATALRWRVTRGRTYAPTTSGKEDAER